MQSLSHVVKKSLVLVLAMATLITPVQPLSAKAPATEISFVWRFTYQGNTGTGTLDVRLVEMEEDTHDIISVLQQFTYPVPCTPAANNGADCDLNIKSAVQHALLQMNFKEQAAAVQSVESYKWMFVEASGSWSANAPNYHTLMANHPSLQFIVQKNAGNQANFTSNWNNNSTTSNPYKTVARATTTMTNDFAYEENVGGVIENTVTINGDEKALGGATLPNTTTVNFQLAPAQIQIRIPAGFQLDSFVIDPGKPGYA